MNDAVTPFRVGLPEAAIEDLRERLRQTRWPEAAPVGAWSQGTPLAWVRELCRYWLEDYDFAAAQERLNRFPQFRTAIDGLDICFIHVRSPHPGAVPLLLTHGWPGSVVEFSKVIGPLADPVAHGGDAADAFHVVCPTLSAGVSEVLVNGKVAISGGAFTGELAGRALAGPGARP